VIEYKVLPLVFPTGGAEQMAEGFRATLGWPPPALALRLGLCLKEGYGADRADKLALVVIGEDKPLAGGAKGLDHDAPIARQVGV
jgi:hypothetical protein